MKNMCDPYICHCQTNDIHSAKFLIGHLTFHTSFESKIRFCKIHAFIHQPRFCETLQVFYLKITGTSCADDARVKVPSFQKVKFFLQCNNVNLLPIFTFYHKYLKYKKY